MHDSDFYSNFFEGLLNRFATLQYESTYRALSDYFEGHKQITTNESDEDKDDFTDVKGIAAITHYSIPSIYTYVQQSKIPYYRQPNSRRLLFSKKEVLEWIKSNRFATIEEIAVEARSVKIGSKKKT